MKCFRTAAVSLCTFALATTLFLCLATGGVAGTVYTDFAGTTIDTSSWTIGFVSGPQSSFDLLAGPATNQVVVTFGGTGNIRSLLTNVITGGSSGVVPASNTGTGGAFKISRVGAEIDTYYDVVGGRRFLGSYYPGWSDPVSAAFRSSSPLLRP
jgi:hypothetical protein